MDSKFFENLQLIHVMAWNEKNATRRIELLEKIYAEDIRMYDKDTIVEGRKAVSDFIGNLIAEDPSFHFEATMPLESLQNSARLFGRIQTSGPVLNSMDFFLLENGKVKYLYAFLG